MAEMNNYFFVSLNDPSMFVIPEKFNGTYLMSGNCIREGFENGSFVVTSAIVSIKDGIAITKSGSKYILREMSVDYKDYIEAVNNNIPILNNWRLKGNLRNGYSIIANCDGNYVKGKITSQDKNFVTLDNGTKYFVMWRNFSSMFELEITFSGEYLDLNYKRDFEEFAGFKCRPVLFS